jgi:hypothetical protein
MGTVMASSIPSFYAQLPSVVIEAVKGIEFNMISGKRRRDFRLPPVRPVNGLWGGKCRRNGYLAPVQRQSTVI